MYHILRLSITVLLIISVPSFGCEEKDSIDFEEGLSAIKIEIVNAHNCNFVVVTKPENLFGNKRLNQLTLIPTGHDLGGSNNFLAYVDPNVGTVKYEIPSRTFKNIQNLAATTPHSKLH